jgi:hypothetical protein
MCVKMSREDRRRFNARKYGLATDICRDETEAQNVELLVSAILGAARPAHLIESARELAAAFADLQRIERVKKTIVGRLTRDRSGRVEHQASGQEVGRDDHMNTYFRAISELEKIERYERRAASRFGRALQRYALSEEKG